jgi:hypothetical protein
MLPLSPTGNGKLAQKTSAMMILISQFQSLESILSESRSQFFCEDKQIEGM